MDKKIAIVTGGTRGIGAKISQTLHSKGYFVIANYHNNDEKAELFSKEYGITVKKWDVSDYSSCSENIKKIEQEFGSNIEVLVNNAGITRDGMMHKMNYEDWNKVIFNNLYSCFNMCRSVINIMRDNKNGKIINISSVNAQTGQLGQTNYSASKAGIIGFTKALALESANKNINVNCVAPGYINTDMMSTIPNNFLDHIIDMIPMKRLGTTNDVARVVAFLVDKESNFITGATIPVNGGYYMP